MIYVSLKNKELDDKNQLFECILFERLILKLSMNNSRFQKLILKIIDKSDHIFYDSTSFKTSMIP